ncbi:transglutaminase-like domain-containing protein [Teredinibacter turnerae]|uniref:transglutaminase-like domain-containing protein n=1 Tax=Teredinibacter turnerae TaxID=2426 RepID=UPI00041DC405|nr:transglutaminase-like domain-containing protein [Teredinibacter turnerae]
MIKKILTAVLFSVLAPTGFSAVTESASSAALESVEQSSSSQEVEQWQRVTLDGEKIGHRHIQRTIVADTINTRETLVIVTRQPGEKPRRTESVVDYFETLNGKPLEILKTVKTKNSRHQMTARVGKRKLQVVPDNKLTSAPMEYLIPQPFYLREGARLALLKKRGDERKLEYFTWSFSKFRFEKVRLVAKRIAQAGSPELTWEIKRTYLGYTDGRSTRLQAKGVRSKVTTLHADDDFYSHTEQTLSGGQPFALQTCDKACALEDFKPLIHVYRQLIKSPYRITDTALAGQIRYTLEGDFTFVPPETGEQKVKKTEQGYTIDVCNTCGTESPPSPSALKAALASTYWLTSDYREFAQVVDKVIPDRNWDNRRVMERLAGYVHSHMQVEVNFSGYATAQEAFLSRSGDCTENALLLAALGRAAGIPTRVAVGLAYNNDQFFGRRYVFVPHAWVQAWTGERWESFDAGLDGFTSGYIALTLSNGEQAEFYRVAEQLHLLDITSALQVKKRPE